MRLREASQDQMWALIRRRMLAETGEFLTLALRRPELAASSPISPFGKGHFSRAFADAFWQQVLGDA